jgi:hypothetical protein
MGEGARRADGGVAGPGRGAVMAEGAHAMVAI